MSARRIVTLALAAFLSAPAFAQQDDSFRNVKPTVPAPDAFVVPTVTRFSIPGTTIDGYLVQRHTLPIVQLQLEFDLGRATDSTTQAGRADVCMDLFDEATAALDKNAFELKKADLGIGISADNWREMSAVSLSATTEQLAPAMALLAEMLLTPTTRSADLERVRARQMAAVAQSRGSADSIASRLTSRLRFGANHAFGGVATSTSLGSITTADCQRLFDALRPDGARLFVQGDVTVAQLQALFARDLSNWRGAPKAGSARPRRITTPLATPAKYCFVDVPGAAQSSVVVMQAGPTRRAHDYAATQLMGQILGGGFSSRINMNLREKNGYTYGARGTFNYSKTLGTFAVTSSVRSNVTEQALREIASELRGMKEPTSAELERERTGALLAFPAQFATGARTLAAASELVFYGLGFDEWLHLPTAYAAVDAAAIAQAARAHISDSDGVIVLVAGDGKIVQPALTALAGDAVFGRGSVVELDADGVPR